MEARCHRIKVITPEEMNDFKAWQIQLGMHADQEKRENHSQIPFETVSLKEVEDTCACGCDRKENTDPLFKYCSFDGRVWRWVLLVDQGGLDDARTGFFNYLEDLLFEDQ